LGLRGQYRELTEFETQNALTSLSNETKVNVTSRPMPLGEHTRTQSGRIRKERGDSLAGNLAQDYPEFEKVDPRTRLDTLKERFDADSLNEVRKALKKLND
jgi:hypothetical protein